MARLGRSFPAHARYALGVTYDNATVAVGSIAFIAALPPPGWAANAFTAAIGPIRITETLYGAVTGIVGGQPAVFTLPPIQALEGDANATPLAITLSMSPNTSVPAAPAFAIVGTIAFLETPPVTGIGDTVLAMSPQAQSGTGAAFATPNVIIQSMTPNVQTGGVDVTVPVGSIALQAQPQALANAFGTAAGLPAVIVLATTPWAAGNRVFFTGQAIYGQAPEQGTALYGSAIYGLTTVSQIATINVEAQGFVTVIGVDVMFYVTINRGSSVLVLSG